MTDSPDLASRYWIVHFPDGTPEPVPGDAPDGDAVASSALTLSLAQAVLLHLRAAAGGRYRVWDNFLCVWLSSSG